MVQEVVRTKKKNHSVQVTPRAEHDQNTDEYKETEIGKNL